MSNLRIDGAARSAIRAALKACPGWPAHRDMHMLDMASMTKDQMLTACAALGIDAFAIVAASGSTTPAPAPAPAGTMGERFERGATYTIGQRVFINRPDEPKRHGPATVDALDPNDEGVPVTVRYDADPAAGDMWVGCDKLHRLIEAAPAPTPAPAKETPPMPASPIPADAATQLATLIASLSGGAAKMDEGRVVELIREHSARPATVRVDLMAGGTVVRKTEGVRHHKYALLLSALACGLNVMLVGPAGSGKTSAAAQAADDLSLAFYFTGAVSSEYKLTGFTDAQGRIVSTQFLNAYKHGGVFLFDEIDASAPAALLAFNAALANDFADFPEGKISRHPDFRCIAAANTFGRGSDRQYVGRMQLDAATLDRYVMLEWTYDPAIEAAMIGMPVPRDAPAPIELAPLTPAQAEGKAAAWLDTVREIRTKIEKSKVRLVVSPRATLAGAKLFAAGWRKEDVLEAVVWKGLDDDSRAKVRAA
jgi:MoxR-like ATPase